MFQLYDNLRIKSIHYDNVENLFNIFKNLLIQEEFKDYLTNNGYNEDYTNDIVDALLRDRNLLGIRQYLFSALVDLQISSFQSYTFESGFYSVIEYLVRESNSQIYLNTSAVSIEEFDDYIRVTDNLGKNHDFDHVIVATPFYCSGIKSSIFDSLDNPYVPIYVTTVLGKLDFRYFGISSAESESLQPHKILTITKNNPDISIASIISMGIVNEEKDIRIFRISSKVSLSARDLDKLFIGKFSSYQINRTITNFSLMCKERSEVVEHYFPCGYPDTTLNPQEKKGLDFFKFELGRNRNIYYLNGVEQAVSSVETQIIGAFNAVLGIEKKINKS